MNANDLRQNILTAITEFAADRKGATVEAAVDLADDLEDGLTFDAPGSRERTRGVLTRMAKDAPDKGIEPLLAALNALPPPQPYPEIRAQLVDGFADFVTKRAGDEADLAIRCRHRLLQGEPIEGQLRADILKVLPLMAAEYGTDGLAEFQKNLERAFPA